MDFILATLTALFSAAASILPSTGSIVDKRFKGFKKVKLRGWITIFCLFCSISLTLLLSDLNKKEGESKEYSNKREQARRDSLQKLSIDLVRDSLNQKIELLIEDNFKLSKALTDASLEIKKNTIGEGYAILVVEGAATKNFYYTRMKTFTKYPIYDVSLLITDFNKAIKCNNIISSKNIIIDQDCYYNSSTNAKFNSLLPNVSPFVNECSFTDSTQYKHLEVKFTSRNIMLVQQLVVRLQQGACPQSYRLYQLLNNGKFRLLKSENVLNLNDLYWRKSFLPLDNRVMGIPSKVLIKVSS